MLSIALEVSKPEFEAGRPIEIRAIFRNEGAEPLAVPLSRTYRLHIVEAKRGEVSPGPGPKQTHPSGVAKRVRVLEPGQMLVHLVRFVSIQPAGQHEAVGWSYELGPGRYRLVLIYECPPHGSGPIESSAVEFAVRRRAGRLRFAVLAWLFGRRPAG